MAISSDSSQTTTTSATTPCSTRARGVLSGSLCEKKSLLAQAHVTLLREAAAKEDEERFATHNAEVEERKAAMTAKKEARKWKRKNMTTEERAEFN